MLDSVFLSTEWCYSGFVPGRACSNDEVTDLLDNDPVDRSIFGCYRYIHGSTFYLQQLQLRLPRL